MKVDRRQEGANEAGGFQSVCITRLRMTSLLRINFFPSFSLSLPAAQTKQALSGIRHGI